MREDNPYTIPEIREFMPQDFSEASLAAYARALFDTEQRSSEQPEINLTNRIDLAMQCESDSDRFDALSRVKHEVIGFYAP